MSRALTPLVAAVAAMVYACSSDQGQAPQVAASLQLSPLTYDVTVGGTAQMNVIALDDQSRVLLNPVLKFTSSDPIVATVSQAGLVAGKAVGLVTITVTSGSASAQGSVAVVTHPAGTAAGTPAVASRPFGIAVSLTGLAYAGRQDLPYLQLTQLPDTGFGDSVKVGIDPNDIVFTSTGTTAYVTNEGSNHVGIIDVAGKQMADSISIDVTTYGSPYRIRIAPDDQHIYVSTSLGWVLEFATATKAGTRQWTLSTPDPVNGLALRPDGSILYATSTDGKVFQIFIATGTGGYVIPGGTLQDIVLSSNNAELWIADEVGEVLVLNASTGSAIDSVTGSTGAFGLTLARDGTQLYAGVPGSGMVLIIDRASRSVIGSLSVGGTPRRIAFNRVGTEALIANEAGYISVVK